MKRYYFLAMFTSIFILPSLSYAWFNASMDYRMLDTQNYSLGVSLANFPYAVNSSGFNLTGTNYKQYVWSKAQAVNGSNYLYFDDNTAYQMVNGSDNTAIPFEVELGNVTSYQNTSVWGSEYIGAWHLSEGGTTVYDSTTNGNNGTKQGVAVPNATGKFAGGWSSVRTTAGTPTNYINISSSITLNVTGSLSWEAWVYIHNNTHSNGQFIMSKGNKNYAIGQWGSGSANNNKLFCRTSDGVTWDITASAATVATVKTWYHVGCSWTNAGGMKIYINGALSNTAAAGGRSIPRTNTPLYLLSGQGENDLNGTIDEVRIISGEASPSYFNASYATLATQFSTLGTRESNIPATCYTTSGGHIIIPVGCALVLAIGSLVI